jgi:hypothetical protein
MYRTLGNRQATTTGANLGDTRSYGVYPVEKSFTSHISTLEGRPALEGGSQICFAPCPPARGPYRPQSASGSLTCLH